MNAYDHRETLVERLAAADGADAIAAAMRISGCVTFGEFIDRMARDQQSGGTNVPPATVAEAISAGVGNPTPGTDPDDEVQS